MEGWLFVLRFRLSLPALVAMFIGGALTATAINVAGASGGGADPVAPYRAAARPAVTPASAGCAVHLTGGAAPAQNYDVCISSHGNVNGFSWGDASVQGPFQYLDNEGYCIARDPSTQKVNYYDAGSVGEAGFGPATTLMASARTYTVTRTTLDGVLEVTQNFFLKPATSQLFVGVIVKNLDSVNHHVMVERYFHPNITAPWFTGFVGGSTLHWTGAPNGFQSISADTSNSSGIYIGVQLHATSRNVYMGTNGSSAAGGGRTDTPSFPSAAGDCGRTSVGSASSTSPGDNYGGVREFTHAGTTPPVVPGGSLKFQFVYRIY